MIRSEEHWLSIIDALQSASIGRQRWEIGLQAFADATGSRSAQLTGIDSNTSLAFNILTNVDPEPAIESVLCWTRREPQGSRWVSLLVSDALARWLFQHQEHPRYCLEPARCHVGGFPNRAKLQSPSK
jgi:hypothetical protein